MEYDDLILWIFLRYNYHNSFLHCYCSKKKKKRFFIHYFVINCRRCEWTFNGRFVFTFHSFILHISTMKWNSAVFDSIIQFIIFSIYWIPCQLLWTKLNWTHWTKPNYTPRKGHKTKLMIETKNNPWNSMFFLFRFS